MSGRTTFTQEMADAICELIADGRSLREICRRDDMPSTSTVCKWLAEQQLFSEQYARAREAQADTLFDDVLAIADQYDTGADKEDPDTIQRARLRIDARKWMAGKLQPKKYGEKFVGELDVRHSFSELSDEELDKEILGTGGMSGV